MCQCGDFIQNLYALNVIASDVCNIICNVRNMFSALMA